MEIKFYKKLENGYDVIPPRADNATYKSILNFSDDLAKPFQRWCRYKEGYSLDIVEQLIKKYNQNPNGVILDPFLGSGSTIVAANVMGLDGCGFEVNPFSFHLAQCKTRKYTAEDINILKQHSLSILEDAKSNKIKYKMPELSFGDKVFNKDVEAYYMRIYVCIEKLEVAEHIKSFLKLGWISKIESFSNYRKAGNGLKMKKYKKPRPITIDKVYNELSELYANMIADISDYTPQNSARVINDSCLKMEQYLDKESVSGIIFSPPYANCFDYTEIYKLELWFGRYIKNYDDLKELKKCSLHSHLNGNLKEQALKSSQYLDELIAELKTKDLWDKRIVSMLQLYFSDMFTVLEACYNVLEKNGFCSIIVGNSSYSNVVIPTDLLLAEYAERLGFKVDKIIVDRYIITSAQQYESTKDYKNYLRESIVCLQKK